jgi:acetolactate synthase-1/2/3 large subunit
MAKAFYIARSGRPGPVLVDITKNAQFDTSDFEYKHCNAVRSYKPTPEINPSDVDAAATIIASAKKPLIVWGQGVILGKAEEEFKTFVESSNIPAAWTILGVSALPTSHPLNVGMVGMHGNYGPNVLTNDCDVLIAIGMRFDDRVTGRLDSYAKQAKVIHLEIDPAEVNKNVKADVAVLGDVKQTLPMLTQKVASKPYTEWFEKFKAHDKIEFDEVINNDLNPTKEGLSMAEVLKEINRSSNSDAIVVSDVGQHQMIACRYATFNHSKSNITSGGLGTMGFALPAALGAKMGAPDREVVAIIGDGGFQMTIQELGTIFQTQAAVKVVVLNNDFLGMVRQWQQLFFDKRYASTEMVNPDFVKIAEGYFIDSKRVTKRADLGKAVDEMMASDKPYFLEVCVEKEDNVFPMIPSGASVSEIRLS